MVAAETILDFAFASYCVLDTKLVRQNSPRTVPITSVMCIASQA